MWEKQDRKMVWIQSWKHSISGVELIFALDDFGDLTANIHLDNTKYSLFSDYKQI